MNVLFLTHLYLPTVGGVQRSVHNLAALLTRRGHEVTIAAHADGGVPRPATGDGPAFLPLRIPSPFSLEPSQVLGRWRDPVNIWRLASWCRQRRIRIVHCHLVNVDTRYALALASILDGVRVVVTLRGGELEHWLAADPTRRGAYLSGILSRADHVTGVAGSLLREAAALVPSVVEKSSVVPNPVDPSALRRGASGDGPTQEEVPYVLFVGRLEAMKDVACLIDAFHRLVAREADEGLELRIVGSGSLEEACRRAATAGPGRDRIRFLGAVPHSTTLGLTRGARALVLPSRTSEGCPNAVLEAMALEVPVVVSDLAALVELVDRGKAGLVFARGDAEALSRSLAEAVRPSPGRDRRVRHARERLATHHDPDEVASAYERIYEGVLSSRRISSS